MLVEMTMQELIRNTEQIPTEKRHHIADQVQIVGGYHVQRIGESDLVFQAKTSTGHTAKIRAVVSETPSGGASVELSDGTPMQFAPIATRADDVQISCNCEDFYYRFAAVNSRYRVLFGEITKPYIPKGPRMSDREPASDQPAICKHVIKLTHLLQSQGIMR